MRVILQGRILNQELSWIEASRNTVGDGCVVHLFVRSTTIEERTQRPPIRSRAAHPVRAEEPLWDTISILRVRRALAAGSPSVLCNLLWSVMILGAWTLLFTHPQYFDAFSRYSVYVFTAASVLSLLDMCVPRRAD